MARLTFHMLPVLLALSSGGAALAQADCEAGRAESSFPVSAASLAEWQTEHQILLSEEVRGDILAQFCAAATAVSNDLGVERDEIDRMSRDAIRGYLDASIGEDRQIAPLQERIERLFSLNAQPLLPELRAFELVRTDYRRVPQEVQVNSGPRKQAMRFVAARPGRHSISGWVAGRKVCQDVVEVVAAMQAVFTCW